MAFRGDGPDNFRSINFDLEKNYFRSAPNEGNFIGLVKLLAGENADLALHIKKCQEYEKAGQRNQLTFLSNSFVSKTLLVISNFLVKSIVSEINRCGGKYGLMMDGTQDVSFQEQISLVVRYVDESNKVVEHTILFFNAKKTAGLELYESLKTKLGEIGLATHNVVGCSFDGAKNMSSDLSGVISYIQGNDNPYCYFAWCLSHRFNLCVNWAVRVSVRIQQILAITEESAKIFRGSYKRMNVWIAVAKAVPNFNSARRLKLIGKTRWSSKQVAIDSIMSNETNLYVLIKALTKVCCIENLEGDALVRASNNLNSWLLYDNVVGAFLLQKVFSSVTPATRYLQKMGLNVLDGVRSLRACKQQLEECEELLNEYIVQADQFIKTTNSLLSDDEEIRSLDCDCYIHLPTEDEKQKKISRIKKSFQNFIQNLEEEIEERVLFEFERPESIHHEIMLLDPLTAKGIFSSSENSVSLKNLCKMNKIPNEIVAINELREFMTEFNQYLKRSELVQFFNDSNIYDGSANEEELPLMIDSESDYEETLADLKSVQIQSTSEKKCNCFECILRYINSNEQRIKKL